MRPTYPTSFLRPEGSGISCAISTLRIALLRPGAPPRTEARHAAAGTPSRARRPYEFGMGENEVCRCWRRPSQPKRTRCDIALTGLAARMSARTLRRCRIYGSTLLSCRPLHLLKPSCYIRHPLFLGPGCSSFGLFVMFKLRVRNGKYSLSRSSQQCTGINPSSPAEASPPQHTASPLSITT